MKVKMTFEVAVDKDLMIDDESLARDFHGDIHEFAKYLYAEEGSWWDGKMTLIKTEIIIETGEVVC